jgi:hypothetical protein
MSDTINKTLLLLGVTSLVGYLSYSIASKQTTENYTPFADLNQYTPMSAAPAEGLTVYYPNCEGQTQGKYMEYPSFTTGAPFQASALDRYPIANQVIETGKDIGTVFTSRMPGQMQSASPQIVGGRRPATTLETFGRTPVNGQFYSTTAKASTDIPAHSGLQSQSAMGKRMLTGRESFIANSENPRVDYGCGRTQSLTDQKRQRLQQFSAKENFEQSGDMSNPDLTKILEAQTNSEMDAGFGPYVAQSVNYTTALSKDKYSRFTDMIRGDIPIVTRNVPWEFQTQVPDVDRTLSNPGYINATTGHGCPSDTATEDSIAQTTAALLNPSIAQQYTTTLSGAQGGRRYDTVVSIGPNGMM